MENTARLNSLEAIANGYDTQMGWLIDPDEQTVLVYLPQQRLEVFDELEEQLPVSSFASELRLTVGELFGWQLD